jgi:hypothetical protein
MNKFLWYLSCELNVFSFENRVIVHISYNMCSTMVIFITTGLMHMDNTQSEKKLKKSFWKKARTIDHKYRSNEYDNDCLKSNMGYVVVVKYDKKELNCSMKISHLYFAWEFFDHSYLIADNNSNHILILVTSKHWCKYKVGEEKNWF